jgi:hypothetical protein
LLVWLWLLTTPFLALILVLLGRRDAALPATPLARAAGAWGFRRLRYALPAGIGAAFVSAVLAGSKLGIPWVLIWSLALVAVGLAVLSGSLRLPDRSGIEPHSWPAHAFAACTGLALAGMSLFVNRPNLDDAYYVNRATATAQLNHIPVRDVLFTHEQAPPTLATGLPVDTFSALEGALGRVFGVQAPSIAYYLVPPVMTFLATWALWRLLRSWAPRSALLCFALGSVFWLWSAQLPLTPGSYFLSRMWQGKVIFAAWLVPTVYVFLTRWIERREARIAVLILAAGICSIGMTASATFVAPLLFATALVPLLARRVWHGLPVVILAGAFPFAVGLVATAKYPVGDVFGGPRHLAAWYFHNVVGNGAVAAIAVLGLWAAPWLARAGAARAMATGMAVVTLLLVAPMVLTTLRDMTHVSNALRRTLWIMPLPAAVGLLAAVPVVHLARRVVSARTARLVAVGPAVLIAAAVIVFGQPLWIRSGQYAFTHEPRWKFPRGALADARSILARYRGPGPILADEPTMTAIALLTVDPKAVDARRWYATLTPEPARITRARLVLTDFISLRREMPPLAKVGPALSTLRVDLVCVRKTRGTVLEEVKARGPYREGFRVRGLICLRRE